jgi:hypothetical protein
MLHDFSARYTDFLNYNIQMRSVYFHNLKRSISKGQGMGSSLAITQRQPPGQISLLDRTQSKEMASSLAPFASTLLR